MRIAGAHVLCPEHGIAHGLAWVVCQHVLDARVRISHLRYPDKDEIGLMLCFDCYQTYSPVDALLRLECPACVDEILRARG